ncbi:microtubule-associated protein 9 [Brachionichthys hirsutus]|uniref:microtubule-associated protein 9 n=1 Tax=Brachionichthys hirsutus TaxID=412623 RepID=UPI0036046B64
MTSQDFRTLAYTKSPKTSKRTTFQDELQAAVTARASKTATDHFYSDEDEDDFLNKLLHLRKKKASALKAKKSKTRANDFDVSDDEGDPDRIKRVSFLKSQRIRSPSDATATSESHDNKLPDPSVSRHADGNHSLSSQHSKDDTRFKDSYGEPADLHFAKESAHESRSFPTSEDTTKDTPLPALPCDDSGMERPDSGRAPEKEPPMPRPRERTLGLRNHDTNEIAKDGRPQTSSASIDTSSHIAIRNSSPNLTEGEDAAPCSLRKTSSEGEQLQLFTKSTAESASRDDLISDDSKEQERKYSTSFEELNRSIGNDSDQLSHGHENLCDTRISRSPLKTSKKPRSVCSRKVESRYLGSLKILDSEISQHETETANSLRANVYQNWLQKNKEELRENMLLKKKQEMLKESKKKEEEARREAAAAAFEAWKEIKTESLKGKSEEKQDKIKKEQRRIQEKEGKKQSAKQVFEQWKHQNDQRGKDKHRKQREAENHLMLKKQEQEAERKRQSISAFSNWCEKKKDGLHEKVTMESKAVQNKAEEEQYMKEERDLMALEAYEKWIVQKDREERRQREARRIQAILSPPPPWSPPNKITPFGKQQLKKLLYAAGDRQRALTLGRSATRKAKLSIYRSISVPTLTCGPQGLLTVECARNTSPGKHPGGI